MLDENYRRKLDQNKYFSPSGHAKTSHNTEKPQDEQISVDESANKAPETTKERSQVFADDKDLELDDPASDEEDAEIPEGSLFDYKIPGVLTKDEVEKLDLDHWKLVVRDALIDLEVNSILKASFLRH